MTLTTRNGLLAAVCGAAGMAVTIGVGELVDGLSENTPSLVVATGELLVDYTPGDVVAVSIETIGIAQKTLLGIMLVALAVVVGALAGRLAHRGRLNVGAALFALVGVVAGFSTARNPMTDAWIGWLSGLLAAGIGAGVAFVALAAFGLLGVRAGASSAGSSGSDAAAGDGASSALGAGGQPSTRRGFLTLGAAGVTTAALALAGRRFKMNSAVDAARDDIQLPDVARDAGSQPVSPSASTTPTAGALGPAPAAPQQVQQRLAALGTFDDLEGVTSYITPSDDFYLIDTALTKPRVNPADWQLSIGGMVEREVTFTLDDILAMELAEYPITLSCVSNPVGGDLVGNAVWTGVPLVELLDRAGVHSDASQVVGRSVDHWTAGFPTEVLSDGRHAIVAVGMNGEPLPIDHGFPARLVVAGLYGYVSAVKWVESVTLTTWEDFDGYWVPRGWSKRGPIKIQSRIDLPRRSQRLTAGQVVTLAGIAWAPNTGISAVEVRIGDGGWERCELAETLGNDTWVQWRYRWTPVAGNHQISVRAIDANGAMQPVGPASPRPNGAEGYHTITRGVAEA